MFTGPIQGDLGLFKNGSSTLLMFADNTYLGPTQLNQGALILRDEGALSRTRAIEINRASLHLSNSSNSSQHNWLSTSLQEDRLNDAAPVTLRNGYIQLFGRSNGNTRELAGELLPAEGMNYVSSQYALIAGGVGATEFVFSRLTRAPDSAAVLGFSSTSGSSPVGGQWGSSSRVVFEQAPSITHGIIGPWAYLVREFATYAPGLGVGALGAAGSPAYSSATIATATATDNVKITAGSGSIWFPREVPPRGILVGTR
jgi:autotransporter-associated beta strand protein